MEEGGSWGRGTCFSCLSGGDGLHRAMGALSQQPRARPWELLVLLTVCPERLPQPGQESAGILEHVTSVAHHSTYFVISAPRDRACARFILKSWRFRGLSSPDWFRAQSVSDSGPLFFPAQPEPACLRCWLVAGKQILEHDSVRLHGCPSSVLRVTSPISTKQTEAPAAEVRP